MMACKRILAAMALASIFLALMIPAAQSIVFNIKPKGTIIFSSSLVKQSNEPACKVWADIIDITYSGKQTGGSQGTSSFLCAGKQRPARYLIQSRIRKTWGDPQGIDDTITECERLYPAGKEIEITILLPMMGPASQLRDRDLIEGTIQQGSDTCDQGVFLSDLRIPTREEVARLAANTQSLSSIAPPGQLLASSSFKACKKYPSPPCPGGRVVQGTKDSQGCFGPPVCMYSKLQGSCQNRCGWTSGSGRCRCDVRCKERGDCCTDYNYLCIEKTCPAVLDPVCSKDGKTYENRCMAQKALAKIECRGECPCRKECPVYKEPVCLQGTIAPGPAGRYGCPGPPVCKMSTQDTLIRLKKEYA